MARPAPANSSERRRLAIAGLALGHELLLLLLLLLLVLVLLLLVVLLVLVLRRLARLLRRCHLRVQRVAGRHGVSRKPADFAAAAAPAPAAAADRSLPVQRHQPMYALMTQREMPR